MVVCWFLTVCWLFVGNGSLLVCWLFVGNGSWLFVGNGSWLFDIVVFEIPECKYMEKFHERLFLNVEESETDGKSEKSGPDAAFTDNLVELLEETMNNVPPYCAEKPNLVSQNHPYQLHGFVRTKKGSAIYGRSSALLAVIQFRNVPHILYLLRPSISLISILCQRAP